MIRKLKILVLGILCSFLVPAINSCKKDQESFNMHYDYFPLNEGHYVVYSVREVLVDQQIQQKDTFNYFIKTVIGDTLTDNSGRIARKFERYYSLNAAGPWTIHDIWTTIIDGGKAELVEENNRTIKLVFAPSEDDEWDMNVYNTQAPMDCYYSDLHQAYSINGHSFSSALRVEQEEFSSYIDSRRKYEVYAKGVGMVHKYFRDFVIINGNPLNVKKGRELEMKLISYGD